MRKYKINEQGRVVALRDFGDVKAGDVGGFVRGEHNLSQDGNCWIYNDATVEDDAQVCGNARVRDHAQVLVRACISGNAQVSGHAYITNDVRVLDEAHVCDNAILYDHVRVVGASIVRGGAIISMLVSISGNAVISGNARMSDRVIATDNSKVYDNAIIFGDVKLGGAAEVCGDTSIRAGRYNFNVANNPLKAYCINNGVVLNKSGNLIAYRRAEIYCGEELHVSHAAYWESPLVEVEVHPSDVISYVKGRLHVKALKVIRPV